MSLNRRNLLKFGAISVAAAATLSGCYKEAKPDKSCDTSKVGASSVLGKHKVVVIGGGFGGLSVAKGLRKKDKSLDVLVIEKNETFMSCPFSNALLGKLDGVNLGTLIHDYAQPVEAHGYGMLHAEVTNIDRSSKQIYTTKGIVEYEILVLSPGIAYDYENQFKNWDADKIKQIQRVAPGALITGKEHVILERNLNDMEDGDVVITVPDGKYRCPPAPFERASLIAAYMDKEDIEGKVIILNPSGTIAKGDAFRESWKDLNNDRIEHRDYCKVSDVDPIAKTVTYEEEDEDDNITSTTIKYEILNLIPNNKANPVIKMSGVETTTAFGKVVMNGCSFQTKTDPNIYAIGDVVGHAIPPSGQTAYWSAKQCADEIIHHLQGKAYTLPVKTSTIKAANICYSFVGDKPEEAIFVTHDFSWTGKTIKGKGNVPKAPSGKFRSASNAKATRDWYNGIMRDLFI